MEAAYAYLSVLALIWWTLLVPTLTFDGKMFAAAAATLLLTVLFGLCLAKSAFQPKITDQKREAAFRRQVFDLCASLILGLKLCEYYSREDREKLLEELRHLQQGLQDFAREEFAAAGTARAPRPAPSEAAAQASH